MLHCLFIVIIFQKEQQCCLTLLDLLPTVECVAPIDALEIKNKECEGKMR